MAKWNSSGLRVFTYLHVEFAVVVGLVLSKLCAGEVNVIEFVEILLEILGKMSVVKPDLHLPYLSRFSISST